MKTLFQARSSQKLKSAALVGTGVASVARLREVHECTILAFHGISEGMGSEGGLDWSLHLPQDIFRRVCACLASNYQVVRLQDLVDRLAADEKPEPNSVVLTFDDGYASNYHLAWPVLREFHLPATIFLATGFVDGTERLWFQRLDQALNRSRHPFLEWKFSHGKERLKLSNREDRDKALDRLLPELKRMPDEDLLAEIDRIETTLEISPLAPDELPEPLRPMTWAQVREMAAKRLVDFGGHTHTHTILSRCSPEAMRREIFTCRDRMRAELGQAPKLFAYPNGGAADYNAQTMGLLREAGFQAACSTRYGRVEKDTPLMELPRYGSPESVWETEATVSGAFEAVKAWRETARSTLWSLLP